MTLGFDSAEKSVNEGKSCAVLLASDVSEKTAKEVRFFSEKKNVPVYGADYTMDDLFLSVGKKTGVVSVNDKGFADKLSALITE